MPDAPTRRRPRAVTFLAAAVVAVVVVGYRRTDQRWCSACWAEMRVRDHGVAGLRLWRSTWTAAEPPRSVARFLPADHVHDADAPGRAEVFNVPGWLFEQVFVVCALRLRGRPSEFAATLAQDAVFGDYLASRIDDGSLDVATVRRLLAVPGWLPTVHDDPARAGDRADTALLRRGTELYAAYQGLDPDTVDLWNGWGLPLETPHYLR